MMTRHIATSLPILFTLGAGALHAEGMVNVLSPGGSVYEGGNAALWGPAGEKLGIEVRSETADEGLPAVRLQVGSGSVYSDIVFLADYEGTLGGMEGILEPIDYSIVDKSQFMPGTATEYCVGVYGYATVMSWNTETYANKAPESWADFWDTEAFPGRRAMRGTPETQIEVALLADGVAPEDLYDVMSTKEGLDRALEKISALKDDISVWWSSGAQHAQLMRDGEVDMSTGWNGRFQSAMDDGGPVDFTFNQGILATDCLGVPKGAPNKDLAMKLIAEMANPESQAKLTEYISYGPVIPAAFDTGIIPEEVASRLPTHPDYLDKLIVQNIGWWVENNDYVRELYENMMTE